MQSSHGRHFCSPLNFRSEVAFFELVVLDWKSKGGLHEVNSSWAHATGQRMSESF